MSKIHIFPFEKIEKGSNIILYGGGDVGIAFYKEIRATNYCNIVMWVDKNYEKFMKKGIEIYNPEKISCYKNYDYVIIAIADIKISEEVKKYLISIGVNEKYIVHSSNSLVEVNRIFENQEQEYKEGYHIEESLKEIDPKALLNSDDRMEVLIRYLFFRDIYYKIENPIHLSLYARLILSYCNGIEKKSYFSENTKLNIADFVEASRKLIASIKNVGFNKEYYIPVDSEGIPQNGSHRLAASLLLEKKVWIKYYDELKRPYKINFKWFCDNGFSNDDKIRILKVFADMYKKCGLLILWGNSEDRWLYLENIISNTVKVVGSIDYDFKYDYLGYKTLIYDIYSDPLRQDKNIQYKLNYLMLCPLKFRVLLVSDELNPKQDLYEVLRNLKYKLRIDMEFDFENAPIVLHSSDNKAEFEHMKSILLSVNNMKVISQRNHIVRRIFLDRIDRIKSFCLSKNISLEDVCVFDAAIMEIFGIRESRNMAIIVTEAIKNKYNFKSGNIDEDLELYIIPQGELDNNLFEDVIIKDDNYHFYFNGLKFANLDILKEHKIKSGRDKDKKDVTLINIHQDYIRYFDDKKLLKEQIRKNSEI